MPLRELLESHPGLVALALLLCSVPLQYYLQQQQQDAKQQQQQQQQPPPLVRLRRYLHSWYEWYSNLEEWLDEVLPPADYHDILVRIAVLGQCSSTL